MLTSVQKLPDATPDVTFATAVFNKTLGLECEVECSIADWSLEPEMILNRK
jgi:hypothetical protein